MINKISESRQNFRNIFLLYGVICLLFSCFVIFCMIVDCGSSNEYYSFLAPLGVYIFLGSTLIVATFRDGCLNDIFKNTTILISSLLPFCIILGAVPFIVTTNLSCIECFLLSVSSLCNTCIKIPETILKTFSSGILIWRSFLQLFGALMFMVFFSRVFCIETYDHCKKYIYLLKDIADININNSIKKRIIDIASIYFIFIFCGILILNRFCNINVVDAFCYTAALITASGTEIDHTFYIISNNLFFVFTCCALLISVFPVQYLFEYCTSNYRVQIKNRIILSRYVKVIFTFIGLLFLYSFMKRDFSFNSLKIDIVDYFMAFTTTGINHSSTEFMTCILFCLAAIGGISGCVSGGIKFDTLCGIFRSSSVLIHWTASHLTIWLFLAFALFLSCSCLLVVFDMGIQQSLVLVLKCILNIGLSVEESSRIFLDKNIFYNLIVMSTMTIGRCGLFIVCSFMSMKNKNCI